MILTVKNINEDIKYARKEFGIRTNLKNYL